MRRTFATMVGALLACTATQILATNEADTETEIRWTTFGVPHIKAANERGLGYGIGYAYARDNLCLLEEEIVTARGERSRFFGPDGKSSARIANVPSDFFFRWLNDDAAVEGFWVAQPVAIQQLLEGYAAGFNRYLNDTPEAEQPAACAGSDWLRPIASADLIRLARRLIVEGGLGNFVEALIAAAPPGQEQIASTNLHLDFAQAARRRAQFGEQTGSNAVAIGSDLSDNGKGILLGNPHFPWSGAARFYQMHLTIPGKLDVMGAALPGMPVINIGFNQHFAWSHTVDTSSHFTLQRLQLDPQDSSRYLVDGQSRPLEKRIVNIEVRNEDGMLANLEHTLYLSEYGPLLNWPGLLGWDDKTAYALQDANLDNTRAIQQWVAMNEATSLAEFKASIERLQGIPWVNTLAADDRGRTLYMNTAVMPNVTLEQTADCLDKAMAKEGLPVLDGSRSACRWTVDKEAAQPGIMPVSQQPVLERRDFVQNSNSSAWMTNPAAPLTGFSPLISQAKELNPRTRFGLTQLARLAKGKITPQQLEHMVTANQVYMANVLMANLLTLCQADQAPQDVCTSFHRWNRQANLGDNARALLYFQRFMTHFQEIPAAWRVPFNPADPIGTPRGILLSKPHVKEQVLQALHIARDEVNELGIAEHAAWGEVQKSSRGDEQIPIPGGGSNLGVYNAIESQPEGDSYLEVIGGSSHIQLVRFTDAGPQARGILSFSQSADPTSSHNRDQTLRFSRQQWHTLPFTEEQINASLSAPVLLLSE